MTARTKHTNESGFTMVVIAALFIAFAVIAAVAVERNTVVQQITRRDAAADQLRRLANAIIDYSVFRFSTINVYPCPAATNLTTTSSSFGKSVNDGAGTPAQDCASQDHAGDAITVLTGSSSKVITGMVPVQELSQYGIGINDAYDPWGNQIVYVVNRTLTNAGTPDQTKNPTLSYPGIGTTTSASTTNIPAPDFILISLGKDGVGAIKRGTTAATITCPNNATSYYRHENCETNDTAFIYMPTYTMGDANLVATSANTQAYFDDIMTWYRQ